MALFVMSAQKKTSLNPGARVAEAAASGTLMGFGFGAFGSAVSYKNTAQAGKALNESGLGGALIELGKTMDEGSAAYTFATELAGKKVSNADVGKLYGLITEQVQDMTPAQIFRKAIEARVSTQEAPVELTPEQIRNQELVDMSREASRLLERKHAVDNASPEVAPVLENIMNALDEMRVNMPVNAQPTPTAILQTPSSAAKLDANIHSQQSADTSVSTNQSAVGALHEAPAKESASLDPTDAELNEAFKAGAEGRRYVPKRATVSAPTTMDTTRLAVTPLDVDENGEMEYNQRRRSSLAQQEDLFEPVDPTQKTSSLARSRPYTVFHEASIGETTSRSSHRRRANKELYARLESDSDFREQMNELFGYDVMAYMKTGKGALKNPSPDLVWHHPVDNQFAVELIYKKDHQNPKLQKYLHSGEGGRGGYGLYYN